jgi:hypothetical protein
MEGVFIMAQVSAHVSTTPATVHPSWCTTEHVNTAASLHQSPEILLGHIVDVPVTVQRVHIDAEPGYPHARDEIWLGVGPHYTEVPLDEAAGIPQQIHNIAAAMTLFLGGA